MEDSELDISDFGSKERAGSTEKYNSFKPDMTLGQSLKEKPSAIMVVNTPPVENPEA